jgi:dephospho-CoA kinase
MILKVGLTGGIATGKTTVAEILVRCGCHRIDADRIARDLVEPGRPGWAGIVDAFGSEILEADCRIDRRRLRSVMIQSPGKRALLNAILHPAILEEEQRRFDGIAAGLSDGIIVTEAALLVEAAVYDRYDRVIVVYCSAEIQVRRLCERERISDQEARQWIRSQMPVEEKKRYGHYLIDTSGDLEDTDRAAVEVFDRLQSDCREKEQGRLPFLKLPR